MIEVDVAVIGSGVAALKAVAGARALNRSYIAIESSYGRGGYIQSIGRTYRYLKSPLFIPQKVIDMLESSGIEHDVRCFNVERHVLKGGSVDIKMLGYREIAVQRNWFREWLEQNTLCYSSNIFKHLEQLLKTPLTEKSIAVSNIRKIDLDRHIVALSNGLLIKYGKLVYTWPLDLLPKYIYMRIGGEKIRRLVESLALDYISIYTLSYISTEVGRGGSIELYIHGTKASRFHTALKIPIDSGNITYIITSYSASYPLLPGITEKLHSEARKYRLVKEADIVEYNVSETIYALINQIDRGLFSELQQTLSEYGVALYGRLGMWREQDLHSTLIEQVPIDY